MRNILRIAALLGVLLQAGFQPVTAFGQAVSLAVHSVDVQPASLTIHGENLLDTAQKPSPTRVMLGASLAALTVTSSSATEIVAMLPANFAAGSYLLTVGYGLNDRQFDQAWIAIGAAGPAGPQGIQGPAGPQGIQGPPGPAGAASQCFEGDVVECYSGAANTRGVGACRAGRRSCIAGGTWGVCVGEVMPAAEVFNGVDDNCNGSVDEGLAPPIPPEIGVSATAISVAEGSTTGLGVKLTAMPAGNLTVTLQSSDTSAMTVTPGSLTFTSANYNVLQFVSVRGEQDANTSTESAVLTLSAAGAPTRTVAVAVTDDDAQQIQTSTTSLAVNEGGSTTLGVRLAFQPSADVTVALQTNNSLASVTPTLTFTPANYNVLQSATVTGLQDADTQDESIAINLTAPGLPPKSVALTVLDDDSLDIETNVSFLSVDESGSATFLVRLTAQPDFSTTLSVHSGDTDEVTVSPAFLTFTSANYNTFQAVAVSGVFHFSTANVTVPVTLSGSGLFKIVNVTVIH